MFMGELCLLCVFLLRKMACVRRISCEYYGFIVFYMAIRIAEEDWDENRGMMYKMEHQQTWDINGT